jgi:xylan 1,4-beta-xylosidase
LSKFFKKQTGKTFSQYLNEIRLAHAVNELVHSDKPITRVALDNGFPNLAAFNRVFNEYHTLKQAAGLTEKKEDVSEEKSDQETNEVLSELRQYLTHTASDKNLTFPETPAIVETQVIKVGKIDAFTKYWNTVINIGYATDILNSHMQEQITLLQNEIGFTYARFWGLFNDDMMIEDRSGETITYNFSNTNRLLVFLIKNKLKPFIELGPKPKVLSKKISQTLVVQEISERSPSEWEKLTRAFLLHCIKRYGIEEVETWYFEIWRSHMDSFHSDNQDKKDFLDKFKKNKHHDPSQFEEYFKMFSGFKRVAKEIVPAAKVGGCGLR